MRAGGGAAVRQVRTEDLGRLPARVVAGVDGAASSVRTRRAAVAMGSVRAPAVSHLAATPRAAAVVSGAARRVLSAAARAGSLALAATEEAARPRSRAAARGVGEAAAAIVTRATSAGATAGARAVTKGARVGGWEPPLRWARASMRKSAAWSLKNDVTGKPGT